MFGVKGGLALVVAGAFFGCYGGNPKVYSAYISILLFEFIYWAIAIIVC